MDLRDRPRRRVWPRDLVFKGARTPAELAGFWRLRTQVFCEEQGLFEGSDADAFDADMIPIVCVSMVMGMEDEVVGAVRIDERTPGVWWGSRLAVHPAFRRGRMSPSISVRNRQPEAFGRRSVGAGLIYKAVSTAHGLGCRAFYALVQRENESFFQKLHWRSICAVDLVGRPHVEMVADLAHYPPPCGAVRLDRAG